MSWQVALRLGRVSNLPTVWTNTLAGIVLAGGSVLEPWTLALMVALSLFYTAGMYLNDAFDAGIDAFERPERPIPAGLVSAETVFGAGFGMMALGLGVLLWVGYAAPGGTGIGPVFAGLGLCAAIVLYNRRHKDNPLSPVLMGICRVLVYVTAGLAVTPELPGALRAGALMLLCYLIGLTYIAKQETLGEVRNLWPLLFLAAPVVYGLRLVADDTPRVSALMLVIFSAWIGVALGFLWRRRQGDVPRAVISLIAGISLLDALLIAGAGAADVAWLAVAGFALTLAAQRFVAGT
jgi:4-hydroxybenzoate polyprenyltransferase